MSQPVWTLSVDLQTKTATFQSGLSDAAKAARGSFGDIKGSARDMSGGIRGSMGDVGYSMGEARHSVMMLGEEFGVHLPRGITTFISSIGPLGAALEAAFPFLAIVLGATLLIEHLQKVTEAEKQAAEAGQKAFASSAESLEEATAKSLELKIQIGQLAGESVAGLETKLRDVQNVLASMKLAPGIKSEFADLIKSIQIPSNFNPLNWLGDSISASKEVKAQAESASLAISNATTLEAKLAATVQELTRAQLELSTIQKSGSAQAIEDQQKLIRLLEETHQNMTVQVANNNDSGKIEKSREEAAAVEALTRKYNEQQEAVLRQSRAQLADHQRKIEAIKQEAAATEQLAELEMRATEAVGRAVEESQKKEVESFDRQHEMVARAIEDSSKMAEAQRKVAELGVKSDASAYLISKQKEQDELRAILQQEQADLVTAHQKEVAEQEAFIAKMNELAMHSSGNAQTKALQDAAAAQDKLTRATMEFNQAMAQNKSAILASDTATQKLRGSWSVYFAQSHQEMLTLTGTLNTQLQSAINQVTTSFAQGMAKSIVEGKNFGASMRQMGAQVAEEMIQHLIEWGLQDLVTKMGMKATAASLAGANATASMAGAPFPIDTSAPAFGATMMGAAMAFEMGGLVPGVAKGDVVPAMLTPGEAVLPRSLTEGLMSAARSGNMGATVGDTHIHHHATYHIHAIDGANVRGMLEKHGDVFTKHIEHEIRRRNR